MIGIQTVLIGLIIFISAIVQSSIGIGFAMFASAVFSFFLHPANSAALIGFASVTLGIAFSLRMRKHIDIRVCLPPMLGMVIARVLGIVTLMHMDIKIANTLLGALLLAFSLYFWLLGNKIRIEPKPWKGFILGMLAGYLGGLYGMTGPFSAIYYHSALADTKEYVASMNFSFLPSGIIGLIMHFCYGNITVTDLPVYVLSAVMVLFGASVGMKLLNKINREQMTRAIYLFMAAMGIIILL